MSSPQARVDDAESPAAVNRRQLFVQQLPKIELHAHLNGSIRRSTLRSLAAAKGVDPNQALILSRTPKNLSEAFDVFRVIHACVTTLVDVERLAFELGEDLEEDGVVYAEIRTTPRAMNEGGLEEYIMAVIAGFERYSSQAGQQKVILRLLLSIDRAKHSSAQAEDIVSLAHKYHNQGVVGIDLSGDPTKGTFTDFLPALTRARSLGLKITLHAGEVRDMNKEMEQMADFKPDRFGHCCFVSDPNLERLKTSGVPIELCLTSNLLSNSVAELQDHHFGLHYTKQEGGSGDGVKVKGTGTICCISTDDSGVFGSALSNEYRWVMETFGLGEEETFRLARRTIRATFLAPDGSESSKDANEGERRRKSLEDLATIQARFQQFHDSWRWF